MPAISPYFNPFSIEQAHAREKFHELSLGYQTLAVVGAVFGGILGLPLFLIGGFASSVALGAAAFRWIVEWGAEEAKVQQAASSIFNKNSTQDVVIPEVKLKENNKPEAPLIVYSKDLLHNCPQFALPNDFPKAHYYVIFSITDRINIVAREFAPFENKKDLPVIILSVRMVDTLEGSNDKNGISFQGLTYPIARLRIAPNEDESKLNLALDQKYNEAVKFVNFILQEFKAS